jgi:hypothetical protein
MLDLSKEELKDFDAKVISSIIPLILLSPTHQCSSSLYIKRRYISGFLASTIAWGNRKMITKMVIG